MTGIGLLSLLLVHVYFSDAIFLFCARFLRAVPGLSAGRIFALTRGLGPAAVAIFVYLQLVFLPGREPPFYLALTSLALTLPAIVWGRRELPTLLACYRRVVELVRRCSRRPRGLVILLASLAACVLWLAVALPLVEHDAISAAQEARIAVRDASLANFMAVREPDLETGYYMENFRTPFLQCLDAFFAWTVGADSWEWAGRWTSGLYYVHCLLLLAYLLAERHGSRAAQWGAFLLGVTPLFFYMGYNNGLDTARLYLLMVALTLFAELVRTASARLALVTAMAAGFALFAHLLAAPSLAWGGLLLLACSPHPWRRRLVAALVLVVGSFLLGAQFHYLMAPGPARQIDRSFGSSRLREIVAPPKKRDPVAVRAERGDRQEPAATTSQVESPATPGKTTGVAPEGNARADVRPAHPPPAKAEGRAAARRAQPPATAPPAVAPVERATEAGGASRPASPRREAAKPVAEPSQRGLVALRGQGDRPLSQWIFGRLQMFTGIEYFGWLFWLVVVSLARRFRGTRRTSMLGLMLAGSVVLTTAVVLSGIRKLSWSNPRYIATIVPMAVYLVAPQLQVWEARFARRRRATAALVLALGAPVALVTSIRGAKIEITNPGTFYQDFRSLRWVAATAGDPAASLQAFRDHYLGGAKTLRYLFADHDTQLRQAHDYLAATLWVRDHLPDDVKLLVFRDARFFYYGGRRAVVWYSPEIDQRQFQYYLTRGEEMQEFLVEQGFTHLLVDDYSTRMKGYYDTAIGPMMQLPGAVRQVRAFGSARLYELLPPAAAPPRAP